MLFFFNDTATTEIYTLSLHDALPILGARARWPACWWRPEDHRHPSGAHCHEPQHHAATGCREADPCWISRAASHSPDRKSTRLNSSHANISYAVFCLKKKKMTSVASY